MILSDRGIRREVEHGGIEISPFDDRLIQPASIDVRLGERFLLPVGHRASHIDPTQPPSNDMAEVLAGAEGITLCPGMPIGQITVMRLDAPAEQGYAERKRS